MPRNVLIVISDQLATHAVGCYGNSFAMTPNIDRLAALGMRFDRAYTPYPLCRPARASFWTGRLPHRTGVLSNGREIQDPLLPEYVPTLGAQLAEAGYECVHFGKTHDHGALRGFDHRETGAERIGGVPGYGYNGDTFKDVATEAAGLEWLKTQPADGPWCCVLDMQNPHNICGFVAENSPGCIAGELPPLPENFETKDLANRPRPVQYVCCAHRRQQQSCNWSDTQWQQYRAAYRHFVEDFDTRLGHFLDALAERPDAGNTTIFFWADHGDSMGAHRLATKHTTFYEETTRVPLIISGAGVGAGSCTGLVNLVDMVPTICELTGAAVPEAMDGESLAPLLSGGSIRPRPYTVSQWYSEWGLTIEPGRMLRTDRFKYTVYREDSGEELFDLQEDPGEQRNVAQDPDYAGILDEHRRLFSDYCQQTNDNFSELEWLADPRWRNHAVGYSHHTGPAAPDTGGA